MTDPKKEDEEMTFIIDASLSKSTEIVKFYKVARGQNMEGRSKEMEDEVRRDLSELSGEKEPTVFKSGGVTFELLDTDTLPFNLVLGANTLIEVNVPYCLHIPDGYQYDFQLDDGKNVFIKCVKVWTKNGNYREGDKASSFCDVFAEDRDVFFKNFSILTPMFPQPPDEGWEYRFTGRNVEYEKDTSGHFRYTKIYIYSKRNYSSQEIEDSMEWVMSEVEKLTLSVINGLIEVYRYATGEAFIEKLNRASIMSVYFLSSKQGIYTTSFSQKLISLARVNKSRQVIDKIKEMLAKGMRPQLYENLMLDARNSLSKGNFSICVVEAFQALEIYLENYLYNGYTGMGIKEKAARERLRSVWQTKDRLRKLVKEITNHDIYVEKSALWQDFCRLYDRIRNEIIHRGFRATAENAEDTLEVVSEIIDWIGLLVVQRRLSKLTYLKKVIELRFLGFVLRVSRRISI